jgi:hypothetical protein
MIAYENNFSSYENNLILSFVEEIAYTKALICYATNT